MELCDVSAGGMVRRGVQGRSAGFVLGCDWCFAEFFCNAFVGETLSDCKVDVWAAVFKDMGDVGL